MAIVDTRGLNREFTYDIIRLRKVNNVGQCRRHHIELNETLFYHRTSRILLVHCSIIVYRGIMDNDTESFAFSLSPATVNA